MGLGQPALRMSVSASLDSVAAQMARGSRLESPLGSAASGLPSPGVRQPRGWTTLSGSELGSGAPAAVGPLPRAVTLALRSLLLLLRLGATFPWSPVPVPARAVHAGQGSAGGLSPHAVAGGGSPSRAGDMSPPPGGAPSGRLFRGSKPVHCLKYATKLNVSLKLEARVLFLWWYSVAMWWLTLQLHGL